MTGEGWDGGDLPVHPEPHPELVEGPVEGHAQENTPSPSSQLVTPPQSLPLAKAGAGIQGGGAGSEDSINTPSLLTGEGWDGGENPENINRNTLYQDDTLSTSTPHLTHPAHPVKSQPHIRGP